MEVYLVTNITNGKQYVGKTVQSVNKRKYHHIYNVNNGSQYHFHRAIRKYGKSNFIWESIFTANNEETLNKKEIEFIEKYGTYKNGYNMTLGGEGTSGFTLSKESREKLRIAMLGRKLAPISDEVKLKLSIAQWGENSRTVKITEKDARNIIFKLIKGVSKQLLADKYDLNIQSIYDIQYRKTWKHIKLSKRLEQKLKESTTDILYNNNYKLTTKDVKEIKDLIKNTLFSNIDISKFYSINRRTVYDIRYGITWKDI